MVVKRNEGDFHKVYRPFRINEVYGQDSIVQAIKNGLDSGELPNRILISGPVGSGKTTLSRIIGMGLLWRKSVVSLMH